jgi:hypothetical protein
LSQLSRARRKETATGSKERLFEIHEEVKGLDAAKTLTNSKEQFMEVENGEKK